jgi:Ca2+/H+ antiporter
LLIAQIVLVSADRVDWHKRLGILGITLAGLMVLVGFATIIGAVRRHSAPGMSTDALFAVDVLQLAVFAILVACALALRTDGATHKRLMILATVALLGPALSRWPYDFVFSSDLAFYGTLDSFLIFMIAFDLWSRRRVHLATILGSSLILVMDFAMRPLAHSAPWHQFTAWVQSL